MKTIAIIQARVGSTRLPGKVLLDLLGKTVLERVIDRVSAARMIKDVVVATTVGKEDLKIVELCARLGVSVFCGSVDDVLDRYYQATKKYNASQVVRITSDCPLIDPGVIDKVVDLHLSEGADYTTNILKETFPDGEDVEVIKVESLNKAWSEARLASEREHVTVYIRKHPELFKHMNYEYKTDLSKKRWTLDNAEDYEFIKEIYKNIFSRDKIFSMEDVISFLAENPDIERLNHHINRNEGYTKSVREDKTVKE